VARRFLVFHTAFIGDLILTLPATQALRNRYPDARIVVVAIPAAAAVLRGHPSIDEVIVYDKRGADRGTGGFFRLVRTLAAQQFDTAIVPHRSLRSALAVAWARIPRRVGFTTSAGSPFLTDRVVYDPGSHETERNLALVAVQGIEAYGDRRPVLPFSATDAAEGDRLLRAHGSDADQVPCVALAPGSVWFTKRWPASYFSTLARELTRKGIRVVLAGGADDRELCDGIASACVDGPSVVNASGILTLRQSAELLRRCRLVITNDSAPLHLAGAVGTPVFALFGATVPAFGFGPLGPRDRVFGVEGLSCRPCAIHGGNRCPIGTFVCMEQLAPEDVLAAALNVVQHRTEDT
jgi:heptosyltransferase II